MACHALGNLHATYEKAHHRSCRIDRSHGRCGRNAVAGALVQTPLVALDRTAGRRHRLDRAVQLQLRGPELLQ